MASHPKALKIVGIAILAQRLALFNPKLHRGEAMATAPVGREAPAKL